MPDLLHGPAFRIDATLKSSVVILRKNFLPFMALAVLFSGPMALNDVHNLLKTLQGDATYTGFAVSLYRGLLDWLFKYFLIGVLAYRVFLDLEGRDSKLGESLKQALARALPLLGLGIAYGGMVLIPAFVILIFPRLYLAFFILIIPSAHAAVIFFAVMPIAVIEKAGPLQCLGGSAALTKGFRWRVSGLIMVVILLHTLWSVLTKLLFEFVVIDLDAVYWAAFAATYILNTAITAYFAVVVTVGYHGLRLAKGGLDMPPPGMVHD